MSRYKLKGQYLESAKKLAESDQKEVAGAAKAIFDKPEKLADITVAPSATIVQLGQKIEEKLEKDQKSAGHAYNLALVARYAKMIGESFDEGDKYAAVSIDKTVKKGKGGFKLKAGDREEEDKELPELDKAEGESQGISITIQYGRARLGTAYRNTVTYTVDPDGKTSNATFDKTPTEADLEKMVKVMKEDGYRTLTIDDSESPCVAMLKRICLKEEYNMMSIKAGAHMVKVVKVGVGRKVKEKKEAEPEHKDAAERDDAAPAPEAKH